MAETYLSQYQERVPRNSIQNNQGILDSGTILKAFALLQNQKELELKGQEFGLKQQMFVADNLYKTHEILKDISVLKKDTDIFDRNMAPVNEAFKRGITTPEQALDLATKVGTAINNPEMRRAILDKKKVDELLKQGVEYKTQLGRNALNYINKIQEVSSNKGQEDELSKIKISDYFDTQTQSLSDAHTQATTNQLAANTAILNTQNEQAKAQQKARDDFFATDALTPEQVSMAKAGFVDNKEIGRWAMVNKMYKEYQDKLKTDPSLPKRDWLDFYRAYTGEDYTYGERKGAQVSYNWWSQQAAERYGKDDPIIIPTAKGSDNKNPYESAAAYWTDKSGRFNLAVENTKHTEAAGRVFIPVGDKMLTLNPRVDNDPKGVKSEEDKTNYAKDIGTAHPDYTGDEASDLQPKWITTGDWTNYVGYKGGKSLSDVEGQFIDNWREGVSVYRDAATHDMMIKYPGKDAVPLRWDLVNEKRYYGGKFSTGDIKTNSIQVIQSFILRAKEAGMSEEAMRNKISFDYSSNGEAEFTIKDVVWSGKDLTPAITQEQIDFNKQFYDSVKGGAVKPDEAIVNPSKPLSLEVGKELLQQNAVINMSNPDSAKFIMKLVPMLGDESSAAISQLQPALLKNLNTLYNTKGFLKDDLKAITDTTPDLNNIADVNLRSAYASDHNGGNALDFSVKPENKEKTWRLLNGYNALFPGHMSTMIFEAPDQATAEANMKAWEQSGILEKFKANGMKVKLRYGKGIPEHVHVSFNGAVPSPENKPVPKAQSMLDINTAVDSIAIPNPNAK